MHLVFVFHIYESLVWFSEGIFDCDVFKLSSGTTVPNFTISTPLCVSFCPQNIENSFKVNDNNWGSYEDFKTNAYDVSSVFALMFFSYLPKSQIYKELYLFKQIISWFSLVRIQFYLFWASGKWVSAKTVSLSYKWPLKIFYHSKLKWQTSF